MSGKTDSHSGIINDDVIFNKFSEFILDKDHPCIMAQSVFGSNKVDLHIYNEFPSGETAREILADLQLYLSKYDFASNDFETFMAVFRTDQSYSEVEFEKRLWEQLQFLHQEDPRKNSWDPEVSSDTANGNFSFSLGGKAFYIVGMHPGSSRIARRSPYPAIAFNLHWQFERLREMGAYGNVRDKIRERDLDLQGEINPMLDDFGNSSEARQYSGRNVSKDWQCPFHKSEN